MNKGEKTDEEKLFLIQEANVLALAALQETDLDKALQKIEYALSNIKTVHLDIWTRCQRSKIRQVQAKHK